MCRIQGEALKSLRFGGLGLGGSAVKAVTYGQSSGH